MDRLGGSQFEQRKSITQSQTRIKANMPLTHRVKVKRIMSAHKVQRQTLIDTKKSPQGSDKKACFDPLVRNSSVQEMVVRETNLSNEEEDNYDVKQKHSVYLSKVKNKMNNKHYEDIYQHNMAYLKSLKSKEA